MPATYDTLTALLIGKGKVFSNENELDVSLMELEDRGLLGWDKRGNRYDLHPIVRGVVWSGLSDDMRRDVYTTLHAHFEAMPKIESYLTVESLEDLTPAIELYNTLIGLGRYDEAIQLFCGRIEDALHYRLGASREQAELLEMLFPDGLDHLPRLSRPLWQGVTFTALAQGYQFSGQPGRALPPFRRAVNIAERESNQKNLGMALRNLSDALHQTGLLHESQVAAARSLVIERKRSDVWAEASSLQYLGVGMAARGIVDEADLSLRSNHARINEPIQQRNRWRAVGLFFRSPGVYAWDRERPWSSSPVNGA